jgi:predicted DNA-binding protein
MASDRLSVRIPEELREELEAVVHATGKSEAEVVREALSDYCLKETKLPTCHDLAIRNGALGCVKGGPTDRSTNPKYLEGMGRD